MEPLSQVRGYFMINASTEHIDSKVFNVAAGTRERF